MGELRKHNIAKIQSTYVQQHDLEEVAIRRKRRGLMRRLAVLALVATALALTVISTIVSQSSALTEKQKQEKELTKQLEVLQKKQTTLEDEIVKLNDEDYIMQIARRDYFLSKENELIFKLPDENPSY